VAPTETSVVIAWNTDTPCHSKVLYGVGEPLTEANNARDGMLPLGTIHSVRVTSLKPGQPYRYQVVSTRVVKLKGYWPDKGLSVKSAVSTFTTFDATRPSATFYAVTDTHEQQLPHPHRGPGSTRESGSHRHPIEGIRPG